MPAYDATSFHPPAPLAHVLVRSPGTGVEVQNVPMLLDSGADLSLLPRDAIAKLIDPAAEPRTYELEGFDGTRSWASVAELELRFLNKSFRGQFLITDGRHGILGRNILNNLSLLLNGPALVWNEHR